MKTQSLFLSYEMSDGKDRTVAVERIDANTYWVPSAKQTLFLYGDTVQSSRNGSKRRHVGYFNEFLRL